MTWVTIRGAMKYLHISRDAIMCAIKQGAIHAYRKPSASGSPQIACLISTDELDDWVRSWDEWEADHACAGLCPREEALLMDTDRYDQTVGLVMVEERMASYPLPLRAEDRRKIFATWCRLNQEALTEMEAAAVWMMGMGRRVSSKYLIERGRYEGTTTLHGVAFLDGDGEPHTYCINNSDSSLNARWLHEKYPEMDIRLRSSMFDGERA